MALLWDWWKNRRAERALRARGFPSAVTAVFCGWQKMRRNPELRAIRSLLLSRWD